MNLLSCRNLHESEVFIVCVLGANALGFRTGLQNLDRVPGPAFGARQLDWTGYPGTRNIMPFFLPSLQCSSSGVEGSKAAWLVRPSVGEDGIILLCLS